MDHPLKILMVDDNESDIALARQHFKQSQLGSILSAALNGEDALAMLQAPEYPKPDIILTDIHMPKMGGKQFVRALKADKNLKNIPVFVMTSTGSNKDVMDFFALGAKGYFVKPVVLDDVYQDYFRNVIRAG